jgi:hypothetical protein
MATARSSIGKKTETTIYHPPKKGMPHLVVTVSPSGLNVMAVSLKDEARILASKKTIEVALEDGSLKHFPSS